MKLSRKLPVSDISILTLECKVIQPGDELVFHGISFSNSIFIKGYLDGVEFNSFKWFDSTAIVLDQLNQSKVKTGWYLLFTCVCGIADDAGWEPVSVAHDRDVVTWEFNHLKLERFSFDREQYIAEIDRLNERLLDFSTFTIQPRYVTFPE